MTEPLRPIDKARWQRLNPLLDELLDMEAGPRAARLAALHALEPELAAELEALLARDAELAGNDFLATTALAALDGPPLAPGQTVGAYTLEREIGRGGMGSVWLARRTDGRYEGQVAIKFLSTGLLGHGDAGRFAREGQILARLAHPHIARLIDAGVAQEGSASQPYLVLEYVDGQPIDRYCEQQRLDTTQRVQLFLDVLAAVAHAHNRLILHRDLKPSNILVDQAGQVKLLDFGIAKLLGDATQAETGAAPTELTQRAGRAFTPQFAAPEQLQGGDVTTATDVYALGVLLYLLLSGGKHPTTGATLQGAALERMRAVIEEEPKRLSDQLRAGDPRGARALRGDLDTIVAKALKKAPAERYANAAALADDLRRWLAHEPIAARPDSRAYRLAKFLRRHRLGVAAGGVATLSLTVGIGLALWKAQEAQAQRVQAEGLIEFMLGDLRKKLEPVGRLDVLDAVGGKAMDYYARQQLGSLDADALGRRSQALHLMGEINEKRGKLDEADRMFREAAASTSELLARAPRNGQRVFDHAQSVYWVGFVAWRRGQPEQAHQHFQRYLNLADQLALLDPSNLDWRMEKPFALQNLGVLKLEQGQHRAALADFLQTQAIWNSLLRQRQEARLELANALGWQAQAQMGMGRYAEALLAEQEKVRVLKEGLISDNNREAQMLTATGYHQVSRMHFLLGQSEEALRASGQALELAQALVALDDANLDWLAQRSTMQLGQAEVLLSLDRRAALQRLLPQLGRDVERLLKGGPDKLDWQCSLRGRLLVLRAALGGEDMSAALRAYLSDMEQAAARGTRFSAEQNRVVADAELRLGMLLSGADGRDPRARAVWRAAATRLQPANDAPSLTLHALALFYLGRIEEARAIADRVTATTYRHPGHVELQRLLNSPRDTP